MSGESIHPGGQYIISSLLLRLSADADYASPTVQAGLAWYICTIYIRYISDILAGKYRISLFPIF